MRNHRSKTSLSDFHVIIPSTSGYFSTIGILDVQVGTESAGLFVHWLDFSRSYSFTR